MPDQRDDTHLIALMCPHCQQAARVASVRCFEQQQLLYMRCPECGKGITKDQIDATQREYKEPPA